LFTICNSQKKKIILTDEGILTYMPFKRFISWVERYDSQRNLTAGIDLKKVDEIWLFNPNLFLDQELMTIRKIDIERFYKTCRENHNVVDNFKRLFKLRNDISFVYDFIYFRQYYSISGDLSQAAESFIDNQICNLLSPNNVYIKDHPAFPYNPYVKKSRNPIFSIIPWEALIILNIIDPSIHVKMPKVYISIASSAMFTTNTLNVLGEFIFVNNIFELYSDLKDETIKQLIDKCKQIFRRSRFYEPKNWSEFYALLSQISKNNGFQLANHTLTQLNAEENDWLHEQYIALWKKQKVQDGNILIAQTKISEYEKSVQILASQVAARDQNIKTMNDQIADCGKTIQSLNDQIADCGKTIQSLNDQIADRGKTIQSLNDQIVERDKSIKSLNTQMVECGQAMQSLNFENVMYAMSKSWRVTRPLRKIVKIFKGKRNA
jgi:uncharacterized coiled-coil protein SlyX